jgi:hypothetical protein
MFRIETVNNKRTLQLSDCALWWWVYISTRFKRSTVMFIQRKAFYCRTWWVGFFFCSRTSFFKRECAHCEWAHRLKCWERARTPLYQKECHLRMQRLSQYRARLFKWNSIGSADDTFDAHYMATKSTFCVFDRLENHSRSRNKNEIYFVGGSCGIKLFEFTIFSHVDLDALFESARLALVPPRHVHCASPRFLADVL